MKIKDLPVDERPRERLLNYGINNISNAELLAIILKTGTKDKSVKELANEVLIRINSLKNLETVNINTFKDIKGLGLVKTIELMVIIELGKRIYLKNDDIFKKNYSNPEDLYFEMKYLYKSKKQEIFYGIYLDNKNNLIERKLLFMGTINRSIVHPREIFKEAYLLSASKIICVHNHPSGDVTPSMEDIRLTKSLIEIGKLQGIPLIDHLIVGDEDYFSFYKERKDLFT